MIYELILVSNYLFDYIISKFILKNQDCITSHIKTHIQSCKQKVF